MSLRKSSLFVAATALAAVTLVAFTRPAPGGWEYHIARGAGIDLSAPAETQQQQVAAMEATLNQLGADGWELAAVQGGVAVMRRPR